MAVVQQPSGRGLDFTDGDEIVLAESPEAIARACVALLSDSDRCRGDWHRDAPKGGCKISAEERVGMTAAP
jgi:hypothetical protein